MTHDKTLTMVVAMDRKRAIGRDGGLPWHLPNDLRHFKQTTLNETVVMGRRTFEEVGKPLPKRQNIVLSKSLEKPPPGCLLAADLDDALAQSLSSEVMIIGGGEIYRLALPQANRLVVTHVHGTVADADTWFPVIDQRRWAGQLMAIQAPDERHDYGFDIRDYRHRISAGRRLCRIPAAGGKPVRLDAVEYNRLEQALLEAIPDREPGRSLADLYASLLPIDAPGAARWRLLRVKLELEAAGRLRRLVTAGSQRLVRRR